MAIQPIDLSTVYSQMDSVSSLHGAQTQAAQAVSKEHVDKLQNEEFMKKSDVHEIASKKEEQNKVKSDSRNQGGAYYSQGKKKQKDEEEEKPQVKEVKDSRIGRYIDIIG